MVNTEPSATGQNATAYHPVMFTFKSLAFALRGAALALALSACIGAYASTIVGRVVGVADGDTVTVLDAD